MRFRNSLRILMYNFGNVYKLLLFRFVTGALFLSISFVIVNLGLHVVFESVEAQNILELAGGFFQALISGDTAFLTGFQENFTGALSEFLYLLGANIGSIVGSLVGVCIMYLAVRFINGTANFAMGSILNDKMESYSSTRFSSAYFRNLGKAVLYQLVFVPFTLVYDLLALAACWFFFFYTPSFLPSWGILTVFFGLSLSMTAFLCLQALKNTFLSAWIPSVVTGGKGVCTGLAESLQSMRGFGGRFSSYLVALYLIVAVNILFGVCTFGSILLITIPASYLLLLCMQLVFYYEDTGKKYFISFRKISGADGKPESMGD